MKSTTKFIEELKTKAVVWQTEDDGSGHKGETTYTFYLADIEQLLTKHEEAVVERIEKELAKVYRVLLEEFAYTGLATEEQWNESISPAFKRLTNVINGRTPDSVTARVYKFPHISTFPTPDNPTSNNK